MTIIATTNRGLIEKYFEEFTWWMKNKTLGLFTKYKRDRGYIGGWHLDCEPFDFKSPEDIEHIVINDDKVEFRIAILDGEKIEYRSSPNLTWKEMETPRFDSQADCYRIQPKEPTWEEKYISRDNPVICKNTIDDGIIKIIAYDKSSDFPYKASYKEYSEGTVIPLMITDLQPFQREGCYTKEEVINIFDEWKFGPSIEHFDKWLRKRKGK